MRIVKVLGRLPIRWCTSDVIGSSVVRSATPRVPTHVYSGVCTAATTPGAPLSWKDSSNAASRSALDACSQPPQGVVSKVEPCWLPSPPPQLLTSKSTNTVTTIRISALWCIPHAENIPPLPVDRRNVATGRILALPPRPSFREARLSETGFQGISALGSLVHKGLGGRRPTQVR